MPKLGLRSFEILENHMVHKTLLAETIISIDGKTLHGSKSIVADQLAYLTQVIDKI